MSVLIWFNLLTALLDSQTKLITAITASQPPAVAADLWTRFADDTRWIHVALSKFDSHMEKVINLLDPTKPIS